MIALALAGNAFLLCGFVAWATGRMCTHQRNGMFALAYPWFWISNMIEHNHLWAVLDAAFFAWFAWSWWNGGGGDDTKRRLRKWARKFQGVRRTAPAAT